MDFIQTNIIWIILGLVVVWIILAYNGLIRTRNRVREAWSDIEVQLKRRYDLIPNLVEAVKGYMAHEKGVFEQVTAARAQAMGAGTREEKGAAEANLTGTLKTLFAVAENYPELKANENFLELQRELADTENKIQAARRFYNGMVMDFNTRIQVFPTNIMASLFSFKAEEFFQVEDAKEREAVKVQF
jgi:LemA protein